MLFNSLEFIFVFLPITLLLYWGARSTTTRKLILLVASYVFYAVWSWRFAALMLATTSVDYFTAQRIHASRSPGARRFWLALSITANLGVLAVFKYYDFF